MGGGRSVRQRQQREALAKLLDGAFENISVREFINHLKSPNVFALVSRLPPAVEGEPGQAVGVLTARLLQWNATGGDGGVLLEAVFVATHYSHERKGVASGLVRELLQLALRHFGDFVLFVKVDQTACAFWEKSKVAGGPAALALHNQLHAWDASAFHHDDAAFPALLEVRREQSSGVGSQPLTPRQAASAALGEPRELQLRTDEARQPGRALRDMLVPGPERSAPYLVQTHGLCVLPDRQLLLLPTDDESLIRSIPVRLPVIEPASPRLPSGNHCGHAFGFDPRPSSAALTSQSSTARRLPMTTRRLPMTTRRLPMQPM